MSGRVVERRAVFATVVQSVMVYSFVGPIDVADVDAAFEAYEDMCRAQPGARCGGFAMLALAGAVPDDATRRRVSRWQQRIAPRLAASALVIDAEGFVASAIRLVLASVRLIGHGGYKERAFGSVSEGADWLGRFLDLDVADEARLARVAHELRDAHHAYRARSRGPTY